MRQSRFLMVCCLALALAASMAWPLPVRVLVTGDMHGWLEPQRISQEWLGGTAEMYARWIAVERYSPKSFLVISCGDNVTGPALATALQGDPVIEVMNRMGYDVCVLGNHEFDFGRQRIEQWEQNARFPFLAANLATPDGAPAKLAAPYMLYTEQGVKVGLIGLITQDVGQIAMTDGLVGQPYADAVRKYVPEMRAQGAQVVIVVAHVTMDELIKLAGEVADLKIPLMLGGHSHELGQKKIGDTWVVNSGAEWKSYSRIDLDYDPATGRTAVLSSKQVWLLQRKPRTDAGVRGIIQRWQQRMDKDYGQPVGYTAAGLQRPWGVYNFIVDAWLEMCPGADFALTNFGGFRQDIPPGMVTRGLILGVMPFANSVYRITIPGDQLLNYLPREGNIGMAGLRRVKGQYVVTNTGKPIDPQATYRVALTDYLYKTSPLLQSAAPKPEVVFADWRQPVYDWLAKHPTSKERPLEALTDRAPRIE